MNKIIPQEIIVPIFEKTHSVNATAKELKISWSTCKRILEEYKIETEPKSGTNDTLNHFSTISTPEDAYWLGIMYTDGWIRSDRNEIGLGSIDLDLIEKFKQYIGKDNKITVKLAENQIGRLLPEGRTVKTAHDFYTYTFSSKTVKNNLIKLGCFPAKSKILQCPTKEQVPDELLWHFYRGCVDGDGWISTNHKSTGLLGTQHFLEVLLTRLSILHYGTLHKKQDSDIWEFYITKVDLIKKVLNKQYENATVYMERKYKKYLFISNRA